MPVHAKHICNDRVIARGTSWLPAQSARMLCKRIQARRREPAGSVVGRALVGICTSHSSAWKAAYLEGDDGDSKD